MTEQNQLKVERQSLCGHVTALKSLRHFLFVAEGNQVSIFNLYSKKTVKSERIFSYSSIHGIRTDGDSKVLFFGSKSLKTYYFDFTSTICFKSCSEEMLLQDWIFDAQWIVSTSEERNNIAVVTAHNCITILNIDMNERLETVQCAENCILYSASILSVFENAVIVAVGTVFKQILLWSPHSANEINKAKVPFHCLEGHKGVIFSVNFNKHHKLLSSTSDDRSIRLWKVHSASEDDSSLEFWEKSEICPSHVLFAHESRVWTSLVLENCILSVGEDSCIGIWSMDGELIKRKKCHKGGSIWCLETVECSETKNCMAITGGSDGGVYCWEIQGSLSTDLISQISLYSRSAENDFPRAVSVIFCNNSKKLMATTNKGWLSFYDIDLKSLKDVYYDETFVSYCNSSVSRKSEYIALGNLTGDLVLLNSNGDLADKSNFKKFKIHCGKIFSLHWLDEESKHLLSCGTEGRMILWKVEFQNNGFIVDSVQELYLPKCKPHWWSTCAIYIDSIGFVVGDRSGNISFYSNDTNLEKKQLKPTRIYKSIHGENGVTDIKEHKSLIYSAGRDGRVLLYCIKEKSLHFLHALKICHELEWIGKILPYGSDLLLMGFHTKYFIVWSSALESTVMTVECGGGHRSWDFHLSEKGQAIFTAIKKKDIIFSSEDLHFTLNKSILKAGVSGKEFCHIIFLFNSISGSMDILAAGGEDNALRIIGFNNENSKPFQIITLCSLSGHLSSIRAIAKTSMIEDNTYLVASVGGRAQMMLWKIKNNSSIECEQLASHILSTSERKSKRPSKGSQDLHVDPQTRLMDVSIKVNSSSHQKGENYIIALACSDSYFRVYNFDATKNLLSVCYNLQLEEHCILRLHCIQVPLDLKTLNKNMFFILASTSGHLSLANHEFLKCLNEIQDVENGIKCRNKSKFQIHLHQSGINAIDVKFLSGKVCLICTGGDDNALSFVMVEFPSHHLEDYEILANAKVHSAHASQITGVKFLGQNTIVSVSIDQRINLWKWSYDNFFLTIALETSKMSSIPDIANLECWGNGNAWKAVVCGEGIEYLSIKR